jgi:hypothetical protein
MTQDEAINKIQALGIKLDKADIDELKSGTQADAAATVADWLAVVQPSARNNTLSEIVKILKQVPDWIQVALKIASVIGAVV